MTRPLLTEYLHNTICLMPTDRFVDFQENATLSPSPPPSGPNYDLSNNEQEPQEIPKRSTAVNDFRAEIAIKILQKKRQKRSQN
jgi:hypothetical protein